MPGNRSPETRPGFRGNQSLVCSGNRLAEVGRICVASR